jgi:hypothetical protein
VREPGLRGGILRKIAMEISTVLELPGRLHRVFLYYDICIDFGEGKRRDARGTDHWLCRIASEVGSVRPSFGEQG